MRGPARLIQEAANALGFEIVRYLPRNFGRLRRRELLRSGTIDVLLDVGAADGRWAMRARAEGFRGRICSFEPRPDAFATLAARAEADPLWDVFRVALGADAGRRELHVAGSSSSLLVATELNVRNHGEAAAAGAIAVETRTLDSLVSLAPGERAYLKIDVQGMELDVLRGAERALEQSVFVELEVSFAELYRDQPLFHDVVAWLDERGYRVAAIDPIDRDAATGDLLSANAFLVRRP